MGKNPTDRGKIGTKRSMLVEGHGLPVAIMVAGANQNDFKMVEETLCAIAVERPQATCDAPQGVYGQRV